MIVDWLTGRLSAVLNCPLDFSCRSVCRLSMLLDVGPSTPLTCCSCKNTVAMASQLLLSRKADQADSDDEIVGHCQQCAEIFDDNRFRRLSSRSWAVAKHKPKRTRDVKFFEARMHMNLEFPDESRRQLREMTLTRLDTIKAERLAEIAKGVAVSIMCRHTECLFYGMEDQWIKHARTKHVRCPQCGRLYQPLTSRQHMIPAQGVVSVTDPAVGRAVCFPATWKSGEDKLLVGMAETKAVNIQTDKDLNTFMNESAESLRTLLAKVVATPVCFVKMDWNSTIESMLDPNVFPMANWKHLKDNGVWGMKMALADSNMLIFDDWDELIGLMAQLLAAARLGQSLCR